MKVRKRVAFLSLATLAAASLASFAAPTHAHAQVASVSGGGPLVGSVTFGRPLPLAPNYGTDSWTFNGDVYGMFIDVVPSAFIGDIHINATGGGAGSLQIETGTVSVSVTQSSPVTPTTGYVTCVLNNGTNLLGGGYGRVLGVVDLSVSGSCEINHNTYPLSFHVDGNFTPTQGDGVTTPITQAEFAGSVVVTP